MIELVCIVSGSILIIGGIYAFSAQYITQTPYSKGYAHAITVACTGLVLVQYGFSHNGNMLLHLGMYASLSLGIIISCIAYERDTAIVKRRRKRRALRGEGMADNHINAIYNDIYKKPKS